MVTNQAAMIIVSEEILYFNKSQEFQQKNSLQILIYNTYLLAPY